MQGIPAGWVTAVPGLSRNAMLRMLGNGVVPQQAAAALPWLLDVLDEQLGEAA
jgi:DNA (cytosine-5)-methyltransferase 1